MYFSHRVRNTVESIVGRGKHNVSGQIGLNLEARKVIEITVNMSWRNQDGSIGTEHLFLALISEESSVGVDVLKDMGINLQEQQTTVHQMMG